MLAQLAFCALIASPQDSPDHSALPELKKIMAHLQQGKTSHIAGSRAIENSATERELEGDFQIFRQGTTHLRFQYSNYWGDTSNLLILTPKRASQVDIYGNLTHLEPPITWAERVANQNADDYGGLIVSFLAPEKDLSKFIDLSKAITMDSKTNEIKFTHVRGSAHTIKMVGGKSVEIRSPQPGFMGFRDPYNILDTVTIQKIDVTFPKWYFEIAAQTQKVN